MVIIGLCKSSSLMTLGSIAFTCLKCATLLCCWLGSAKACGDFLLQHQKPQPLVAQGPDAPEWREGTHISSGARGVHWLAFTWDTYAHGIHGQDMGADQCRMEQ